MRSLVLWFWTFQFCKIIAKRCSLVPRPSTPPAFDRFHDPVCKNGGGILHTGSDQKLEVWKAWERGYRAGIIGEINFSTQVNPTCKEFHLYSQLNRSYPKIDEAGTCYQVTQLMGLLVVIIIIIVTVMMSPRLEIQLLTLYQPMTAKAVMSSHKPIRIYMGNLILGVIL